MQTPEALPERVGAYIAEIAGQYRIIVYVLIPGAAILSVVKLNWAIEFRVYCALKTPVSDVT